MRVLLGPSALRTGRPAAIRPKGLPMVNSAPIARPDRLPNHAVILAGGMATRLGALAKDTPKPLLSVAGRPFIAHIIAHCRRHGVREFIVLAGPHQHAVRPALRHAPLFGASTETG